MIVFLAGNIENVFLIDLLRDRYCENFSLVKDLEDNFPPGMERKLP